MCGGRGEWLVAAAKRDYPIPIITVSDHVHFIPGMISNQSVCQKQRDCAATGLKDWLLKDVHYDMCASEWGGANKNIALNDCVVSVCGGTFLRSSTNSLIFPKFTK